MSFLDIDSANSLESLRRSITRGDNISQLDAFRAGVILQNKENLHDTFPVYDWILTDDEDNIWVALFIDNREYRHLLKFNDSNGFESIGLIPKSVKLYQIQNHTAFGISTDPEFGTKRIVHVNLN